MTARRALWALSLALPSCASTTGQAWLDSPVEPRESASQVTATYSPAYEAPDSRPRLQHTVTLGESYEPTPEVWTVVGGQPVPVQVTVNTQIINSQPAYGYMSGYGYGYGYGSRGYGYGYGYGAGRAGGPIRASRSAGPPITVGGDFPAPPSYGPRALR